MENLLFVIIKEGWREEYMYCINCKTQPNARFTMTLQDARIGVKRLSSR